MRYLAEVEGKQRAESFVAWLITKNIETHIEAAPKNPEKWEIWIRDEDKLAEARQELNVFQSNPDAPEYLSAVELARQIIKEKQATVQAATKNVRPVTYRGASPTQMVKGPLPPLTLTLVISCIAISLLSNFTKPNTNSQLGLQIVDKMFFVSPIAYRESGNDAAASLKRGEVWRAVTPIFLHADPIHLFMNMLGLIAFGRVTERLVGTPRFALMVLILAVLPMLLACLMPRNLDGSPFTVGISGVLYGLVGYLWLLTSQRPQLGFRVPDGVVGFLLLVIVLGFAGIIRDISNWGHLGGFVVGLLLALMERK
jgi:GlpG protein